MTDKLETSEFIYVLIDYATAFEVGNSNQVDKALEGVRAFIRQHFTPMTVEQQMFTIGDMKQAVDFGTTVQFEGITEYVSRRDEFIDSLQSKTVEEKEHKCIYCGAMTAQPDEECYRNPNLQPTPNRDNYRAENDTAEILIKIRKSVDNFELDTCVKRIDTLVELIGYLNLAIHSNINCKALKQIDKEVKSNPESE